jgi:hypothetical protein
MFPEVEKWEFVDTNDVIPDREKDWRNFELDMLSMLRRWLCDRCCRMNWVAVLLYGEIVAWDRELDRVEFKKNMSF